jgi:PPOX class probable F420-dependent enzyme
MAASPADLDALKQFATDANRAVLITRRKDGGVQSSPMTIGVDDDGNVLTATRAKNAKVYNLTRDPSASLCIFNERWPGPWLQVDGEAEITHLPEAMPLLAAYYQRRGQDTTAPAFRERMLTENRVLIKIKTQRVVRPSRG